MIPAPGSTRGRARRYAVTTDAGVVTAFRYADDQLVGKDIAVAGEVRSVDFELADGQLQRVTYPEAYGERLTIEYEYWNSGHLKRLRRIDTDAEVWRANSYTARDQVRYETFGNGVNTVRSYDPQSGRPTDIHSNLGPMPVQALGLGYDYDGRAASRTDGLTGSDERFVYDAMGRLDEWHTPGETHDYDYDPRGNLSLRAGMEYRYDGSTGGGPHAVSQVTGVGDFRYDSRGRRTSSPGWAASYTSFDLPSSIDPSGESPVEFTYDGQQRLVARTSVEEQTAYVDEWFKEERRSGQVVATLRLHTDRRV